MGNVGAPLIWLPWVGFSSSRTSWLQVSRNGCDWSGGFGSLLERFGGFLGWWLCSGLGFAVILSYMGSTSEQVKCEQFLPVIQGNMSPWHLCKYQGIKCPSERPFCCLLMAPGGAPVSSWVFL